MLDRFCNAIDGVKFVGTLDGKTCIYCASLDGQIWRDAEMGQARRPPIHPNCRCTLIPYVELKDDDGNVVDLDEKRPAANADFDKLAKDAYNQNARDKGLNRRWEDLSPSTRLKYYYQAQKDYEKRTGNKAYEQVSGSTSFAEYFENQDEEFKRSWLGEKRYELYKNGKLNEEKIFSPVLSYKTQISELHDVVSKSNENDEDLRYNGDYVSSYKNQKGKNHEIFNDYPKILKNIQELKNSNGVPGFEEQNSVKKAEDFISQKFGIEVHYPRSKYFSKKYKGVDFLGVANDLNRELCRAFKIFGTIGLINIITTDESLPENTFGRFNHATFTITIHRNWGRLSAFNFIKKQPKNYLSTTSPYHGYRHEIGHAIYYFCLSRFDKTDRLKIENKIKIIYKTYCDTKEKAAKNLSEYSQISHSEMVAEAIAMFMNGESNTVVNKILSVLMEK